MGGKPIIPDEDKISAVLSYLQGSASMIELCNKYKVHKSSFKRWVIRYKSSGKSGLIHSTKNANYTIDVKINAAREYLDGLGSLQELCIKYNISSNSVLLKWIKKYNGHELIKSRNSLGGKIMTNGRKTTYEERVEIVSFCIANNDNYQLTSEKYSVSYQQVYTWTKKYKKLGFDALLDRRGKRKKSNEMTETEKLTAQLKLIEAENKHLKMENDFLKKLDEVERRREAVRKDRKTFI